MSLPTLRSLEKHAERPFQAGYPADEHVTLYAPDDNVGGALASLIGSVESSLALSLPGLDDEALAGAVRAQLGRPWVYVSLSVALRPFRDAALDELAAEPHNSVAYGQASPGFPAAMAVIDGLDAVSFSSGILTVTRHPIVAARARARLDLLHESLLKAGAR